MAAASAAIPLLCFLCVDQFMQDDFLRPVADITHPAYPFHLVGCFQGRCHSVLLHRSRDKKIHTLMTSSVNVSKVLPQLPSQEQADVGAVMMLFQKTLAYPIIHAANAGFGISRSRV